MTPLHGLKAKSEPACPINLCSLIEGLAVFCNRLQEERKNVAHPSTSRTRKEQNTAAYLFFSLSSNFAASSVRLLDSH